MPPPPVSLVPFTAEQLALVQPWFQHPEVVRRLGGPEWVERELQLLDSGIGEMFRGRRVLRTHSWVAFDEAGDAVAHIGGEVYDRWCRYAETPEPHVDQPIVDQTKQDLGPLLVPEQPVLKIQIGAPVPHDAR
jgi:hypothetical protein